MAPLYSCRSRAASPAGHITRGQGLAAPKLWRFSSEVVGSTTPSPNPGLLSCAFDFPENGVSTSVP